MVNRKNTHSIKLFLTAFLGLSLFVSISAAQIVAALLLVDFLFDKIRSGESARLKIPSIAWSILVFILWTLISTAVSRSTDVRNSLSSQSAFLLTFLAAYGMTETQIRVLAKWFCVGAVWGGVWAVLQKASGVNYLPDENTYVIPEILRSWPEFIVDALAVRNGRAVGPRSHPLTFAESFIPAFFVLVFYLAGDFQRTPKSIKSIAFHSLSFLFISLGIIFSEGRAVLMGLVFGLPALGFFISRKTFWVVAVLMAAVFLSFFSSSPKFRGRMMSVVSSESGTLGDQQSKSMRFELWRAALGQIAEHPLTGKGTAGVSLVARDPVTNKDRRWTEAHNIFLQHGAEWGIVGLGLFLWILILAAKMILENHSLWKAPLAGSFVAFMTAGGTESWTNDKEIAMIFWMMVGCIIFLRDENRIARENEEIV